MKKASTTLILTAFLLTGYQAFAATEGQNKGYISVSAQASEELLPTTVKLSFAVQTTANDAQTAAENNKKAYESVISAVKPLVDEKKGEWIKTVSYNLTPNYVYKDGARKLTGYNASNALEVTLKDVQKAENIISTALKNGANMVSGVNYTVDSTSENCNTLIGTAAKAARQRADETAQSLGTSVIGIKNINTGCSTSSNFGSNFRMMKSAEATDAGAVSPSMAFEAGRTRLDAFVNAEFYVK